MTVLYQGDHRCPLPPVADPGAIIRCDDCRAVWRLHSAGQTWLRVLPLGRWLLRRRGLL